MRALLIGVWLAVACAGASEPAGTGPPQGLSPEQIQKVVQSKMKVLEGCAVVASATGGSLKISFQVAPSGAVDHVEVADSSVDNPALEACLVRTFERMKFPAAKVATRSEFPFRLRSKQ